MEMLNKMDGFQEAGKPPVLQGCEKVFSTLKMSPKLFFTLYQYQGVCVAENDNFGQPWNTRGFPASWKPSILFSISILFKDLYFSRYNIYGYFVICYIIAATSNFLLLKIEI